MSDTRICFVGDSFVAGVGDPQQAGWVGRIASRTHQEGMPSTSYNLGVRRQTSTEIAARLVGECVPRLPVGCEARVVLSFGVNDTTVENGHRRVSADDSVGALTDCLDQARHRGWPAFVVGPPPVGDALHNDRTRGLDERLALHCSAAGVPYVPTLVALQGQDLWMQQVTVGDGAHPAAEGYALLADLVWPAWWSWLTSS